MKRALLALSIASLALAGCPSKTKVDGTGPGNGGGGTGDTGNGNVDNPVDNPSGGDGLFPDEPFRHQQPVAGKPRDFQLPKIQTFKLGNQIDVYLIEKHELPTVSIELNLEGGSVNDPKTKTGLASVCMQTLSESTKSLDKTAFDEALADIAARVGSYAGSETQGVSMSTLTKHFDATFALFSDVVTSPGFRKADFNRIINRRVEGLKQARATAGSVAGRVRGSVIYGPKHPRGSISSEKAYKAIRLNDCKKYHRSYIKPAGARLFVVGDMTKAKIEEKFAPLLKKWKGKPKKSAKMPKPAPRKGKVFFVDMKKDAPQSVIYVMHDGPTRKDPEFFANMMMASILGGGFSSRINMNLREDKGYSYGARGGFGYTRTFGTFAASSSVRADSTYQSVLEIVKEMRNMREAAKPATAEELAREKNGAILGLPARFSTARSALGSYTNLVYYDLPLDYYDSYVENISGVTLDQVGAAAKKLVKPDDAIILVVGNGKQLQNIREGAKDVPLNDGAGKQMTLRDALNDLAKSGKVGKGTFVVLDADGKVLDTYE